LEVRWQTGCEKSATILRGASMTDKEKYAELIEAIGEIETERLIVQSLGTIAAAYEFAVDQGSIVP
jgi:hypothetical protein